MNSYVTAVKERVGKHFAVDEVSENVLRFVKQSEGRQYAVCYLDLSGQLPKSPQELDRYQDRVLGQAYFNGPASLQWSNYLYFVTRSRDEALERTRDLIESDRRYARKYVIADSDLESVLNPPLVKPHLRAADDVLSRWLTRLAAAGLDGVVSSSLPVTKRLLAIENGRATASTSYDQRSETDHDALASTSFVRTLELTQYRRFPVRRRYECGIVNLIHGPNGSGKTSFLEALELYYCGRHKRNPSTRPNQYEIKVEFDDGTVDIARSSRAARDFRARHLAWYGQSEAKTDNLYMSFARFNFLDTDAAVSLAASTDNMDDDLARLLVGPEASRVWREIERVSAAVDQKVRDLEPLESEIRSELMVLKASELQVQELRTESSAIEAEISSVLTNHGWMAGDDLEGSLSRLAELGAYVDEALTLHWGTPIPTLDLMRRYLVAARESIADGEGVVARLSEVRSSLLRLEQELAQLRVVLEAAVRIKIALRAHVPQIRDTLASLDLEIVQLAAQTSGFEPDYSVLFDDAERAAPLASLARSVAGARSHAERDVSGLEAEYAVYEHARSRIENLERQLREVAGRILKERPTSTECPLCRTMLPSEVLVERIRGTPPDAFEDFARKLLERKAAAESAAIELRSKERVLQWLESFCRRRKLSAEPPLRTVLEDIESAVRRLENARAERRQFGLASDTLEAEGVTFGSFELDLDVLRNSGWLKAEGSGTPSESAIEAATSAVEKSVASTLERMEMERRLESALNAEAITKVRSMGLLFGPAADGLDAVKAHLARAESLGRQIESLTTDFPMPADVPIVDLSVTLRAIRGMAARLTTARARELTNKKRQSLATGRKQELEPRLRETKEKISRFESARLVLQSIQESDSLERAVETAVRANRGEIEQIFTRIHSPAEFSGLGSSVTRLIRRGEPNDVSLSEVSTGQRAAFALSVFLAQNAALSTAPPIMLIDDPIAQVDDLNALSFLDYMRDVAISGKRQIFFATADAKVASLFSRKFEFLGSEFRRFALSRHDPEVALAPS